MIQPLCLTLLVSTYPRPPTTPAQGPGPLMALQRAPRLSPRAPKVYVICLKLDYLIARQFPQCLGDQHSCCSKKKPYSTLSLSSCGNSDARMKQGHFCCALLEEESSRTGSSIPPPNLSEASGVLRTHWDHPGVLTGGRNHGHIYVSFCLC